MEFTYESGGTTISVVLERTDAGLVATIGERRYVITDAAVAGGRLTFEVGGHRMVAHYHRTRDVIDLARSGRHVSFQSPDETRAADGGGGGRDGRVTTPMPGKVVSVAVARGDRVTTGDTLLVLESMKMQNDVSSPVDGVVSAVHHAEGDNVDFGDLLVEIDPDAASPDAG